MLPLQKKQTKEKQPSINIGDALSEMVDNIRTNVKQVFTRIKKWGSTNKKLDAPHVVTDRELVLPALRLLGQETSEKIFFLKTLQAHIGWEIDKISVAITDLLKIGFSEKQLVELDLEDAVAIFKIWEIGAITTSSISGIYEKLPIEIVSRSDVWLSTMVLPVKSHLWGNNSGSGATTLEDMLRFYTAFAAEDVVAEDNNNDIDLAYNLFQNVIKLAGGYAFPLSTLKMTALWSLMLEDMMGITKLPDSFFKRGAIFLSLWISMATHMVVEDAASKFGKLLNAVSENTPDIVKDSFYSFYEKLGGDSMNAKKYLAWNKTAGVLIEKETLDMCEATRMMSTFKMGMSFIRCLNRNTGVKMFLDDISFIPDKRTIHDILTLYRLPEKYILRTNKIYANLDGMIKDQISETEIQQSAFGYFELLKLKLSYLPHLNYGQNGMIINPQNTTIDKEIINMIAIKAFANTKNNLYNWIRRLRFERKLKLYLLKTPMQKNLEYYGS